MKSNKYKKQKILIFILLITMINLSSEDDKEEEKQQLFSESHNSKYLWGTYKPNLYFAMKQRKKETPVFGLMWYGMEPNTKASQIKLDSLLKHECDQNYHIKYYWPYHNGIDYSNEIINDNNISASFDIKTIKTSYETNEQSWSTIISGRKIKKSSKFKNIALILYFSLENFPLDQKAILKPEKKNNTHYELIGMRKGNEIEKISFEITGGEKILKYSDFQKYRKGYEYNWRVKEFVLGDFKNIYEKKKEKDISFFPFDEPGKTKQPNIVAIEFVFSINDIKEDKFEIIVQYSNNLNKPKYTKESLLSLMEQKAEDFEKKFENIFPLKSIDNSTIQFNKNPETLFEVGTNDKGGFQLKAVDNSNPSNSNSSHNYSFVLNKKSKSSLYQMAKESLSNLLGGIGYFYGNIKVKNDNTDKDYNNNENDDDNSDNEEESSKEKGLFTATPCRSYFARGFLWDEGFHQLIISKWDIELSLDMVNTWFDTMDNQGWIPREQIRGVEAESQVPPEFVFQNSLTANPPTLLFPIKNFINHYKFYGDKDKNFGLKDLLIKFYEKLKLWMYWYNKTQRSVLAKKNNNKYKYLYQWNKRDSDHNFPSGFDDLPRGMMPNDEENHLDLNIWLLELEKTLFLLSSVFDKENMNSYEKNIQERKKEINEKLFCKDLNIFADYLGPQSKKITVENFKRKVFPYLWRNDNKCGLEILNPIGTVAECNPYSDKPCCSEFGWCGNTPNHCNCEKCKKSLKLEMRKEYKNKENTFNPHIGYVNLFPLFFGDFEINKLGHLFKYLSDSDEFMSNYGIRSLVRNDLLYHTGDDYWRGKVWIPINYLTLNGLFKYYMDKNEEAKLIYNQARNGLINAVYKSWKGTHTFYENYDDFSGQGLMSNPFNGWTSAILLILSENYD